jgi:hypothetical protein
VIQVDTPSQSERRIISVRRLPAGEGASSPDRSFGSLSMEERMELVWQLTLGCLAWHSDEDDAGEPRLRRSVCRIERGRR